MIVGSSRMSGIGPYSSLRTRPNVKPEPTLPVSTRRCSRCGALLRPSNPSDICAPCAGAVNVPEWALAIATLDDRPDTLNTLAARIIRGDGIRTDATDERNRAMLALCESGDYSQYDLADRYGLSRGGVQKVLQAARKERHEREHWLVRTGVMP